MTAADPRDQIRDTIAQALEAKQHSHEFYDRILSREIGVCGDGTRYRYGTLHTVQADAVLAALQTGGWELVKLPEADGPDGGGQYTFDCGTVSTVTATPNDDGSWSVWDHDFDMDAEDARLLAAALLAAAAAAEREANHG